MFSQIMALEQKIQLEKTRASQEKESLVRNAFPRMGKQG